MNSLLSLVWLPGAATSTMAMQTGVPATVTCGYRLSIQAVMTVFC
ncbi:hypothetical protein [Fibrivirga algicola]|nr:hypothetical protein [Fibrivirga algicola]